ncbi:hypothetical protein J9B46_10505 [Klebsiella pneumoniae]|nr:hypothetical protein [Klebsiella pneumoniae]
MTDTFFIDDTPKIEFSLFDREGGFLKYTAPTEIVSSAFSSGILPEAGTELSLVLDSVEIDSSGNTTIKIMLKRKNEG